MVVTVAHVAMTIVRDVVIMRIVIANLVALNIATKALIVLITMNPTSSTTRLMQSKNHTLIVRIKH